MNFSTQSKNGPQSSLLQQISPGDMDNEPSLLPIAVLDAHAAPIVNQLFLNQVPLRKSASRVAYNFHPSTWTCPPPLLANAVP